MELCDGGPRVGLSTLSEGGVTARSRKLSMPRGPTGAKSSARTVRQSWLSGVRTCATVYPAYQRLVSSTVNPDEEGKTVQG